MHFTVANNTKVEVHIHLIFAHLTIAFWKSSAEKLAQQGEEKEEQQQQVSM